MTYNVFSRTLSLTQSINLTSYLLRAKWDAKHNFVLSIF